MFAHVTLLYFMCVCVWHSVVDREFNVGVEVNTLWFESEKIGFFGYGDLGKIG